MSGFHCLAIDSSDLDWCIKLSVVTVKTCCYTTGNAAEERFSTRCKVSADNGGVSCIAWKDYWSWKHYQVDLVTYIVLGRAL